MSAEPETRSQRLLALYEVLREDVAAIAGAEQLPDGRVSLAAAGNLGQRSRRNLVRAVFAFIEGITFGLKHAAVQDRPDGPELGSAERSLAAEQLPDLDEKGRVVMRPASLRLKANLRFAFTLFGRIHDPGYALDVSGKGWQAFQRAIVVRNRLMHPKRAADLSVSNHEVHDAVAAFI